MKYEETSIAGLFIAQSEPRGDARGSFMRLYCQPTQVESGLPTFTPVQINQSKTTHRGTVRGLHFQHPPSREAKMVRCLKGRIFDVAVDIRRGSPTFLKHVVIELSGDNARAMIIPPGCAHGFQTLEDDCEMIYLHSAAYDPALEGGLRHDDPVIGIDWPLPVDNLSDRDKSFAFLDAGFKGIDHAV